MLKIDRHSQATHGVGYALSLRIGRELCRLPSRGCGGRSQDLFEFERHGGCLRAGNQNAGRLGRRETAGVCWWWAWAWALSGMQPEVDLMQYGDGGAAMGAKPGVAWLRGSNTGRHPKTQTQPLMRRSIRGQRQGWGYSRPLPWQPVWKGLQPQEGMSGALLCRWTI